MTETTVTTVASAGTETKTAATAAEQTTEGHKARTIANNIVSRDHSSFLPRSTVSYRDPRIGNCVAAGIQTATTTAAAAAAEVQK